MTIPNISGVEWTLAHVELRGDWIYGFLKIGWFTWSSSAAFFFTILVDVLTILTLRILVEILKSSYSTNLRFQRLLGCPGTEVRMKRLGSVGCNPNTIHL